MEVLAQGCLPAGVQLHSPGRPVEWVLVRPLRAGVGLLQFEVQRGAVLSAPLPVLGLPSWRAVHEAALAQEAMAGATAWSPDACGPARCPLPNGEPCVPF